MARSRLEALGVEEADPGRLSSYFRVAASIAESATSAEAVALGHIDDRIAAMPGLIGEATITLAPMPTWAHAQRWFNTEGR